MLVFLEILFFGVLVLIALPSFGYPIFLWLCPSARESQCAVEPPRRVSLIISAYNEEDAIAEKLENALALNYAKEFLEIIVISDASTDRTDEIVRSYSGRGVHLFRQEQREGKSAALTQFVPKASGEIVVFSDANSMYEPDSLRYLVSRFADPLVGYVVGQQRYRNDGSAVSVAESLYWKYESWLKAQESRVGSVVGGDGAIYAIRRNLFVPLQPDDISDFTLPLRIVAAGYRGVYEPSAVCYEDTAASFDGEFRRKVRIVNRSLQAVRRVPQVLNPLRVGRFAVQLCLHKVMRWLLPFFLVLALVLNLAMVSMSGDFLVGKPVYEFILLVQVGFYAIALSGMLPTLRRSKLILLPYYFLVSNVAAAVGVIMQLSGRTISVWRPERGSTRSLANRLQ